MPSELRSEAEYSACCLPDSASLWQAGDHFMGLKKRGKGPGFRTPGWFKGRIQNFVPSSGRGRKESKVKDGSKN
jgi:hypothetical protein